MSSRSYFYNRNPHRSRSYSGKKRIYGSAYQPGKTTKYQRYGRTMRLDPGYINIPRELPTRQSQLRQVEELRKAGLIPPSFNPDDISVNGLVLKSDPIIVYGSTQARKVDIPIIERDEANRKIYINFGCYIERFTTSNYCYVKLYDYEGQQVGSSSWTNKQYINLMFSANSSYPGAEANNFMYNTSQDSPITSWTNAGTISNMKLSEIGIASFYDTGNYGSDQWTMKIYLRRFEISY